MPRHAVVCAGFGKYVGIRGFGGLARARAHTHTHTHVHTYTQTKYIHIHVHQHIQSHASCHVILYVMPDAACFVLYQ